MNVVFVLLTFTYFRTLLTVVCVTETWSSYEKNGTVCYYCSPGYYWIGDCTVLKTQAQCKPCPENYYQTSQNIAHYCSRCSSCDQIVRNFDLAAEIVHCTAQTDTVCGCKQHNHFIEDRGGMGVGICHPNQKCPAGSGVLRKATNFTDTQCKPCIDGSTYSSSDTFESCIPCRTSCPDETYIVSVCNVTRDMECKRKHDTVAIIPKIENTTGRIVLGVVLSVFFVIACSVFVFVYKHKRCLHGNKTDLESKETYLEATKDTQYEMTDEFRDVQLKTLKKPENIPEWINTCITDDCINWERLFTQCVKHVMEDWETFIRLLFDLSNRSDDGRPVVSEIKETYDREKTRERIYQACNLWKEKCYLDDEMEMINVFVTAFTTHGAETQIIK